MILGPSRFDRFPFVNGDYNFISLIDWCQNWMRVLAWLKKQSGNVFIISVYFFFLYIFLFSFSCSVGLWKCRRLWSECDRFFFSVAYMLEIFKYVLKTWTHLWFKSTMTYSLVHSSFMLFRNCCKRSCLLRVREVWCMPHHVSCVNIVSSWLFTLSEESKGSK